MRDNPVDPGGINYQGFTTVATANEIEAATEDGAELVFQRFTVSEVLDAQAYRLEIATDEGFSNVVYTEDTFTSNIMESKASLTGDTYYWRGAAMKGGVWGKWTEGRGFTVTKTFLASDPQWSFQQVIAPGATGIFDMGSNDGDSDEKPVHSVTLTRAYDMNTHEVTNAQYAAVMNEALDRSWVTANTSTLRNVSGNQQELLDIDVSDCRIDYSGGNLVVQSGYGDHPVVEVTWYGAMAFAYYLNELEGREQTYSLVDWSVDHAKAGYRLPTEAEWEYAARGGASSRGYTYSGSNTVGDVGWYSSNSGSSTHPVGQKQANELGLYDMSGNVWEWCWDWSGSYSSGSQTNPTGPSTGSDRVLRGGSWYAIARSLRSANRFLLSPGNSYDNIGFRLVRPAVL